MRIKSTRIKSIFRWLLGALAVGSTWLLLNEGITWAQALEPYREYEPVVMPGGSFLEWVGKADITKIALYTWNGSQFTAIPFQIDKRRLINLRWNLNAPNDPLGNVNVCEYGYFREINPPTDSFADGSLNLTDEITFMVKDAGDQRAGTLSWHPSANQDKRYEIILSDKQNGAERYVYAYLWSTPPSDLSPTNYVIYTQDPQPHDPPCEPGADSCGVAESNVSIPSQVTLKTHFLKNWVTDEFTVKPDGNNLNLLNRIHYTANFENEDGWSKLGYPRFLGVTSGTKPIRIIRGVQGAESGKHTTKYEFVYATQLVTQVNLRVHALNDLTAEVSHGSGPLPVDFRMALSSVIVS